MEQLQKRLLLIQKDKEAQDNSDLSDFEFLSFTVNDKKYQYLHDKKHFYEVMKSQPYSPSSWFSNNSVISDGSIYLVSRVHPLFVALPFLITMRERSVTLDALFVTSEHTEVPELIQNEELIKCLPEICEISEKTLISNTDPIIFVRLDETKFLDWITDRISRLQKFIFNKYTQDGIYKGQSTEDSKHMHSCLLDSFKYISSYVDECFYPAILDRIHVTKEELDKKSTPSITETLVSSPAAPSKTSPSKSRKTSKRTSEVQKESKKTNSLFNYFQSKN